MVSSSQARQLVLKVGTVAPRGTSWAKSMEELGDTFEQLSDGKVTLRVYAGVVGDEPTIVRKMRVGQLHGAVLTSTGLSLIAPEPMALQLPMVFDNYTELDAARDALEPTLNAALERQGFVVLAWGDAGWMRIFSKRPVVSPADVSGMKIWMWAHDAHGVKIFSSLGFTPVVLSSVDLVPSLQTGMIEALPATAMVALSLQAYSLAPHMNSVKWGPMVGATVVSKKDWERIPTELRKVLLQAARDNGAKLRAAVRAQDDEAIAVMQRNGLTVHTPDAAQRAAWDAHAKKLLAMTRGVAVDAALFDQVLAVRDRVRGISAARSAPAGGAK